MFVRAKYKLRRDVFGGVCQMANPPNLHYRIGNQDFRSILFPTTASMMRPLPRRNDLADSGKELHVPNLPKNTLPVSRIKIRARMKGSRNRLIAGYLLPIGHLSPGMLETSKQSPCLMVPIFPRREGECRNRLMYMGNELIIDSDIRTWRFIYHPFAGRKGQNV